MESGHLRARGRPLARRERGVLSHLLSGEDPLSLALRDRVEQAVVLQGHETLASIHLWAGPSDLAHLTGGVPQKTQASWSRRPGYSVFLVIAGSGDFSHVVMTDDRDEVAALPFPPAEELSAPSWGPVT